MGHRRNNWRSAANSVPGRHISGRRNSIGAIQTSMNRMRNYSPTPHYSLVCCSSQTSRRISVNESNHRSYIMKQERGTYSQHLGCSEKIPSWFENSSSTSTFGLPSDNSDSNGSGSSSSKKSERPTSSRPSNLLRYKTELCRSFEESGDCRFGVACTFAHGLTELRAVHRHPLYKTVLCRTYHSLGYCQYGARCHFVHDPEEAAGVSPMRGHKLRASYDRLGSTLLAVAENSITQDPSASDILLANLRRLHAVRSLQEQSHLLDASLSSFSQLGTSGNVDYNFNPLLNDGSSLQSHQVSTLSAEPSPTKLSVTGSSFGSSVFDTLSVDGCMDTSVDTGVWSTSSMSTSPSGDPWWGTFSSITPLSPDPETPTSPYLSLSLFPIGLEMREAAIGLQGQPSIANPMEVSRSLQLPTIAELCHI
ncbi:uncharacterized protein [Panulirus ornatus]|uniref:uncharacterized protein n=1 Tax=Panulirus ornatus TaxID=150431 RepID=UPI003A8C7002